MQHQALIDFLGILEKLKCNLRHSWTSSGRQESVAEHSWRLAVLWLLVEDEILDVDTSKILRMCLIHDFGEAVCGDIPSFNKTQIDEKDENEAVDKMLHALPEKKQEEFLILFEEMREMKSRESRIWRALDMMEAAIQHNEADISTWLPLEHKLNPIYGEEEAECEPYIKELRAFVRKLSDEKLKKVAGT